MSNKVVFRWIHLSDIHFQEAVDTFNDAQIRAKLPAYLAKIHPKVDAAFFSGDFRYGPKKNQATEESVVGYVHSIVEPLKIDDDHVIMVPGNHDLDRSDVRTLLIDGLRKNYKPDEGTIAPSVLTTLTQEFPFYSSVQQHFKNSLDIRGAHPHAVVDLGDCTLLLLNTSILAGKNDDEHQLILGSKLLSDVLDKTDLSKKPVIAVGHHGFDMMMDSEKLAVSRYLEGKGINLYLCGHEHRNGISSFGKKGKQVNVGCMKQGVDNVMAGFSIGSLYQNGTVEITMHKWDRDSKGWIKDSLNSDKLNRLLSPGKSSVSDGTGKKKPVKTELYKRKTVQRVLAQEDGLKILNDYLSDKRLFIPDLDWDLSVLKDGSLCSDSLTEKAIRENLERYGLCVVKAASGRGKTLLAACVAKRYIKEGFMILRTNSTWSLELVLKQMAGLLAVDGIKALIILENVHTLNTSLDVLYDKICSFQAEVNGNGNLSKFLFLLNMRPALEDGSQLYLNSKRELFVALTSRKEQNRRARLVARHLAAFFKLDYNKLYVNGRPLKLNPQPDLRSLRHYFTLFNELPDRSSHGVKNVTDAKIVNSCIDKYELRVADEIKRRCLYFLGALGYFDAPVDTAFLHEDERLFFAGNLDKGWYCKTGAKYHLNHSTDAQYLCEALCCLDFREVDQNAAIVKKMTMTIQMYFERIVQTENITEDMREDLRNDFVYPVVLPLRLMPGFKELYNYFRQVDVAKQVVSRLYPSYCYDALIPKEGKKELEERISIYKDNVDALKKDVDNIPFVTLNFIDWTLHSFYKYKVLNHDLFGDVEVLRQYLACRGREFYGKKNHDLFLRSHIRSLGPAHMRVIKEMRGYFPDDDGTPGSLPLIGDVAEASSRVAKAYTNGEMSFEDASMQINEFISIVLRWLKRYPYEGSSTSLSFLCSNISQVSLEQYESLVNNAVFINAVRVRVPSSKFKKGELYLFSNIYGKDSIFKAELDQALEAPTIEEQQNMGRWYRHIVKNYDTISEDSLAYKVGEVLRQTLPDSFRKKKLN